jgi:hypothetical protein
MVAPQKLKSMASWDREEEARIMAQSRRRKAANYMDRIEACFELKTGSKKAGH